MSINIFILFVILLSRKAEVLSKCEYELMGRLLLDYDMQVMSIALFSAV